MSTAESGAALSSFHRYPFIIGNIRIPLFFKFIQNPNKLTFSMKKEYKETKTIGGYVFEHWGKKPTTLKVDVLIKKDSSLTNYLGLNTSTTNFGVEDPMYSPELQTLQTLFNIDQRKIKQSMLDAQVENVISTAIAGVAGLTALASNPVSAVSTVTSGVLGYLESQKGVETKIKEPTQASIEGYLSTLTDSIILYKGVIYSGFFTDLNYEEDAKEPFSNRVSFNFLVTNTNQDWVDSSLTQTASGRTLSTLLGASTSIATIASMLDSVFKGDNTNGHV